MCRFLHVGYILRLTSHTFFSCLCDEADKLSHPVYLFPGIPALVARLECDSGQLYDLRRHPRVQVLVLQGLLAQHLPVVGVSDVILLAPAAHAHLPDKPEVPAPEQLPILAGG